ncbi:MAG TPA: glycosyltransferase family 4 protein [Candidatus Acidoferrales bacterium]
MRNDETSIVICPSADSTWGFPAARMWILPGLSKYRWWGKRVRYGKFYSLTLRLLRSVLAPVAAKLQPGDTLYIHNRPEFALAASAMCRKKGVRVVLHLHNSHLLAVPAAYRSQLDVDALVFCSAFLKQEAGEYADRAKLAAVILNGADDKCFFPAPAANSKRDGDPVVLFVGRLVPEKGIEFLIEALRMLNERGVKVSGKIIGSTGFGHDRTSEYVDGIKRNLPAHVLFAKYISGDALAEEFRRATIFCCPSVGKEPFGMVNVEAMATRLPVVASAVGGIPEIFSDGGGILVQPGSAVEIADAIELLLKDAAKRQELADRGYEVYQARFRWPQIRGEYLKLIRQVSPAA